MPYSGASDPDLPSYVKKLSEKKRSQWVEVFNNTVKDEGEEKAFKYANGVVKRKKDYYSESDYYVPDKRLFDFELNYRPYGASEGKGCANCWFNQSHDQCYMKYGNIAATGICDMFMVPPGYDEPDEEGVLQTIKSLLESIQ